MPVTLLIRLKGIEMSRAMEVHIESAFPAIAWIRERVSPARLAAEPIRWVTLLAPGVAVSNAGGVQALLVNETACTLKGENSI
ncbi:MAG: hypothetical protein MUO77_08085 [Anaerolineales bacterium]|nr:hypothetical protein [Anaerolineales bacterium]